MSCLQCQSLFGVAAFVGLAWILSERRRAVGWRVVIAGLALQLALVLNAQQYSVEQIEFACAIAHAYADMGGDAVIASDPGLILALAEAVPGLRIQSSAGVQANISRMWMAGGAISPL